MYLFLEKLCEHSLLCIVFFSVFYCSYLSKNVVFSEKKLFLLIDHRYTYRDSQCHYLVKCVGDQGCWPIGIPSAIISLSAWEIKGVGVPLFSYWHWEALAGSANISLTLLLALGSPSWQCQYLVNSLIGTGKP